MKLTDYIAEFLVAEGIQNVFGLTGGSVVHLFDSIAKNTSIKPVFNHHEQAAALAAEAYARVKDSLGAAIVTTGPGGTNAITGVCAAWLDSIPCIYISGQVRIEHTVQGKPVRQRGAQHFEIVSLVSHITKYAVMVEDPKMIKYHLQKAVYLAKSGRPGPVWIDIPLNFQWVFIEPDELPGFDPSEIQDNNLSDASVEKLTRDCFQLIASAKRPLILAGYGIRLAKATMEFSQLVEISKIPFVSSWNASDIVPTNNEFYIGRPGISGQRGANFAIQNCDLLLSIGSHLSIPLTGTKYDFFAKEAKKIVVDIDPVELKNQNIQLDLSIQCDAKKFLLEMLKQTKRNQSMNFDRWFNKCSRYKSYNLIPSEWYSQKDYVNPYVFIDTLSNELDKKDIIVVDGGGTVVYTTFQAFKVKEGQRLLSSSGIGAMGTGLPESIGACFANNGRRTICLCGDGSMQLNIQELQTVVHHNLNIKIFVFNNSGYLAIRHTQDGFLDSKYIGSDESGGLSLPDLQKVAEAYGIKTTRIHNHQELREKIGRVLKESGPILCEIMISRDQQVIPRIGFDRNPDGTFSPRPLEDMYPYLDRKEYSENMIVKN